MGIDVKEKTAHNASVGADAGQSIQKDSDNSIPASEAKDNGEMENPAETLEEMYRRMQHMADPRYLHTLTMTELSTGLSSEEHPAPAAAETTASNSRVRYFFILFVVFISSCSHRRPTPRKCPSGASNRLRP